MIGNHFAPAAAPPAPLDQTIAAVAQRRQERVDRAKSGVPARFGQERITRSGA
jgi:hypothetical protein